MTNTQRIKRDLNYLMERVINDADHFIEDIRGQKHLKRLYKKDIKHLQDHLSKLIDQITYIESEFVN